jgi:uncharacterized phage-associated protein
MVQEEGPMRFRFDERKAAQAAAYLLTHRDGRLNYMALIKLLYLADRAALLECGQPITGDRMVSMPHGTVLSQILELIHTGSPETPTPWFELISEPERYEVSLRRPSPPTDELSRFELGVLDEVDKSFGMLDQWALRRLTHELPEYHDPEGSSLPILPEEILRAEGKSPEEIERVTRDAEELWFFARMGNAAS